MLGRRKELQVICEGSDDCKQCKRPRNCNRAWSCSTSVFRD